MMIDIIESLIITLLSIKIPVLHRACSIIFLHWSVSFLKFIKIEVPRFFSELFFLYPEFKPMESILHIHIRFRVTNPLKRRNNRAFRIFPFRIKSIQDFNRHSIEKRMKIYPFFFHAKLHSFIVAFWYESDCIFYFVKKFPINTKLSTRFCFYIERLKCLQSWKYQSWVNLFVLFFNIHVEFFSLFIESSFIFSKSSWKLIFSFNMCNNFICGKGQLPFHYLLKKIKIIIPSEHIVLFYFFPVLTKLKQNWKIKYF